MVVEKNIRKHNFLRGGPELIALQIDWGLFNQWNSANRMNRSRFFPMGIINGLVVTQTVNSTINQEYYRDAVGLDLVAVQPLTLPDNLLEFMDYTDNNYQVLPNEEGWFTDGTFESLMIKIDMLPFRFILPRNRRRRRI
jgi:hypothetical protein